VYACCTTFLRNFTSTSLMGDTDVESGGALLTGDINLEAYWTGSNGGAHARSWCSPSAEAAFFISIVPSYLPDPPLLVMVSGVAEILGGLGLLARKTRRTAAWGLILLLICVFPANVNMALHPGAYAPLLLWLRLPLQGILIALLWWAGLARGRTN
jgi:uncharacterized membrane protein